MEKNGTTCKACPNDRAICLGGDRMIILDGWWRPHNLSDNIVECKNMP